MLSFNDNATSVVQHLAAENVLTLTVTHWRWYLTRQTTHKLAIALWQTCPIANLLN